MILIASLTFSGLGAAGRTSPQRPSTVRATNVQALSAPWRTIRSGEGKVGSPSFALLTVIFGRVVANPLPGGGHRYFACGSPASEVRRRPQSRSEPDLTVVGEEYGACGGQALAAC